jgi:hypothetical protein
MSKHLVVVISDLHCGSTVGLSPERWEQDDGGFYAASPAQKWLLERWEQFWETVRSMKRGRELTVVVNGDIVEGSRFGQISTVSAETMEYVAGEMLKPVRKMAKRLYLIRGTPVHVKSGPGAEEQVGRTIGSEKIGRNYSAQTLALNVGGVRFNFSHHPASAGGKLPWTRGTGVRSVAMQIFFNYKEHGEEPPDIVVRSHLHVYDSSPDSAPVFAVRTPAFCLANEFALKVGAQNAPISTIGGLAFVIDDGRWHMEKLFYSTDPPKEVYIA